MAKSNNKWKGKGKEKAGKGAGASRNKVSAPQAVGFRAASGSANISGRSNGLRVKHREYLYDLVGGTTFSWDSLQINPGLRDTFPWLCNIAAQYEQYQFHKLEFHFQPTCSTTTPGTVAIVIDYDPVDPGPETKTDALAYASSVYGSSWTPLSHRSTKSNLVKHTRLYTRHASQPANTDLKTYDVGTLFLCADGQGSAITLGGVWVEYDVELFTPQLVDSSQVGYMSTTPSNDPTYVFGTSGPVLQNGTIAADVVDGTIVFKKAFEGMVYLLQNIGASDAYGPITIDTNRNTTKSASVLGSTKKLTGDVGTRIVSTAFRVIADAGQRLAGVSAASGYTPTSQNIRFSSGDYELLST